MCIYASLYVFYSAQMNKESELEIVDRRKITSTCV